MADNSSISNKIDNTQDTTHPERQPLLSFFKSTTPTKKQQQKDKSPATDQAFTSTAFDTSNNDSPESNNSNGIGNYNNNSSNYGSVGESSSGPRSQYHQNDQQQSQQSQQDSSRVRLYIVLALLLGIIFMASLVLLLLAPKFAQKSFENGVQLAFDKTSIQNVTQLHGVNIISMNVAGSVTLLASAYDLSQKITSLFGDIHLLDTTLQVFQAAPTTLLLAPMSSPRFPFMPILLQSSSMGNIQLPALTLSSESNVTHFDFVTQFVVEDSSALINFCKDALVLKQVGWQVLGKLPVQVGWLPIQNNVDLNKVVNIDGMNGLKQTEMKNMAFPGTHQLGGIALHGTVGIFNPSKTLSMTIGDVDFGIYLPGDDKDDDDVMIAVVRAENTQLLGQQMNYFNVTGRTLPLDDKDTKKKRRMEGFLTQYLHGNTSVVHVRGSTFGPDDDPSAITTTRKVPDWLQKALTSITLTIPFPGTTHNDIIRSLTMDNIKIDFSMVTGGAIVSGDATALLQLPNEMQFDLDVTEIEPDVYIYLEHDSVAPFARLRPPKPCPAKTIHRGDPDDHGDGSIPDGMFMVKSSIEKAPFKVLPGHESEFEKFLDRVFKRHNSTVYLQGTADAMVVSDFGKLTVRNLTFKGQINTMGMQEMKNPPPKVISMSIVKGHPDALQTKTKLIITNPSDVDVNLGTISLAMLYKGFEIGNVTIQELNLLHGSANEFESTSFLYAKAGHQRGMCYNKGVLLSPVVEFVGNYISGESTDLVITGRKGSTKSKLLASMMKHMVFTVQVPTFDEQALLQNVQMNLLSSTAVAWLRNPFKVIDMQIININASATYQSQNIGSMYANFTDGGKGWHGPVDLPPMCCSKNKVNCIGYVVETPRIPVMMKSIGLDMISKALGGKIEVDVDSIVTVMIDSFMLSDLQYKRNNITAVIKKSF